MFDIHTMSHRGEITCTQSYFSLQFLTHDAGRLLLVQQQSQASVFLYVQCGGIFAPGRLFFWFWLLHFLGPGEGQGHGQGQGESRVSQVRRGLGQRRHRVMKCNSKMTQQSVTQMIVFITLFYLDLFEADWVPCICCKQLVWQSYCFHTLYRTYSQQDISNSVLPIVLVCSFVRLSLLSFQRFAALRQLIFFHCP